MSYTKDVVVYGSSKGQPPYSYVLEYLVHNGEKVFLVHHISTVDLNENSALVDSLYRNMSEMLAKDRAVGAVSKEADAELKRLVRIRDFVYNLADSVVPAEDIARAVHDYVAAYRREGKDTLR